MDSNKPVIVLDPGHGGIDDGATGVDGTLEKAIVLEFAKLLKAKLDESGLYTVHLTRDDDRFIPLGRRVDIGHEPRCRPFRFHPCRLGALGPRSWRADRPFTRFRTKHPTNWPKILRNRKTCPM
ncbi:N-acetylmuramoyl-L-alanine amidase [Novosphingobium sp. MW5]|nr:N-acetylmuramoyl-L-alanine amidase [Novosphingobium sp. MW5]